MKTPIAYYGGKQQLAGKIVRILAQAPAQKIYCEPFFGGGAVFFARGGAEHEVINDANRNLVTFWKVLQKDFPALKREIDATLHSRDAYRHALVVLENPDMFDKVKTAWAVWTASNESYGHKWGAGFAYGRVGNMARKTARSREALTEEEIAAIRAHVFEEKHNLSGGFKHFDPSAKIALAWQRLERADFTELDILLLQHELEELTIMKETGYGYDKAHLLANEKYPWEYKEKGGFTDEQIREINAKRLKNLL